MKQCYICGYCGEIDKELEIANPVGEGTIIVNLCGECYDSAKTMIVIKCATCGAHGLVPITEKSMFYFAESNLLNGIATTTRCPVCVRAKSSERCPECVIH